MDSNPKRYGRGRGREGHVPITGPTGHDYYRPGALQKHSSGYGTDKAYSSHVASTIGGSDYEPRGVEVEEHFDHFDSGPTQFLSGRGRGIIESQLQREAEIFQKRQEMSKPIENLMENLDLQETCRKQEAVLRHGVQGQQINLCTNYIKMKLQENKGVFMYEVKFEPEIDALYVRLELLKQMQNMIGTTRTFDGVLLYLPFELGREACSLKLSHPFDESDVHIKIIFKKKQEMRDCIQLYNVLFKRVMIDLKLARLGRHHFDPRGAKLIPQHKLEVWPGYVTAIDEHEGGLLLCCDTSSKVLRTQTVLEMMYDVSMARKEHFQTELKNVLLGACVLTRYNNRLYRVDDIDFSLNPNCTFDRNGDGKISFREYYKTHYNLQIRDMSQPLLVSRVTRRQRGLEPQEQLVVLVPELCFMTGLTDEARKDFRVMKDIAQYTRVSPNQRYYALGQFVNSVQNSKSASALLASWGLTLDSRTVEIKGRVVDTEKVIFAGKEFDCGPNADWGQHLTSGRPFEAVDLINWVVIHSPRDERTATLLITNLMKAGSQMGCKIESPDLIILPDDCNESYVNALREIIDGSLQLVLILFPASRDDRYSAVKKICCSELPIASQVVISRTLSRPDKVRSIVQKIALQINCKIGGSLWSIRNPYKTCMVIGLDVARKKGLPSVTGLVCSMNPTLTQWYSKVAIQKSTAQPMSDSLQSNIISAIQRYRAVNNTLPDRIFLYRDGLSDGMLQYALEWEVEQVKASFSKVLPDYNPKFTYVIVQKKPNAKLFSIKGNNLDNPPPGTVVDHTINQKYLYDFYLVSQNVRQGTASPSHYIVLYDNSEIKPDHIQRFSYKLCHLYYNWPGTVRVPAPCQYAAKLATLVCLHTKREHGPKLEERLFFL